MISLHAFSANQATSTALSNLAPAAGDASIASSGNLMFIGPLNNLLGAYALGATLTRAQLQSPTLLNLAPYDVTPVDEAALPTDNTPLTLQLGSPMSLTTNEGLEAYVINADTENNTVLVFLSDGPVSPVNGKIFHARGTITTGTGGVTWTNAAITLSSNLPNGTSFASLSDTVITPGLN